MHWLWRHDKIPGNPAANMAADAQLLIDMYSSPNSRPTVRIYRWDRPSVSIGRLQNEKSVRDVHPTLPIVRRPTGGRAVLHGNDLTITVATQADWLPRNSCMGVLSAYQQILGGLVAALHTCGIRSGVNDTEPKPNRHLVNCFDLTTRCDIVEASSGRKILGSAQRRERGALLQQMSIPNGILADERRFLSALQASFQVSLAVTKWIYD